MSATRELKWTSEARAEYLSIRRSSKEDAARIDTLLQSAIRSPEAGLGNPIALRGALSNCYARRIDGTQRLVYLLSDERVIVLSCINHQ